MTDERVNDEGLMWEDYWAEEDAAWRLQREIDTEMDTQSRQIRYEADARAGFPLGEYGRPLHKDDLKRSR